MDYSAVMRGKRSDAQRLSRQSRTDSCAFIPRLHARLIESFARRACKSLPYIAF